MRLKPLWRDYWSAQNSPQHRDSTAEFYRRHAAELTLMMGAPPPTVLELGCGDGALYEALGFDAVDYTGVDFSPAMLEQFATRHPDARLVLGDAADYRDDARRHDLVFSNQVVQYLDKESFGRLLANASAMLAPRGAVVTASVPCRALRLRYFTGEYSGQRTNPARNAYRIAGGLVGDRIGRWYSFAEIDRLGEQFGFRSELYGSIYYPYRFHVRMTRDGY
jgi:cyclopropane fatty-acyl-phospholipid synthase-like methyltransferase